MTSAAIRAAGTAVAATEREEARREHRLRLAVSLAGFALMLVALLYRGVPRGPAIFEVVGMGGLFFGGSAVFSFLKLRALSSDAAAPRGDGEDQEAGQPGGAVGAEDQPDRAMGQRVGSPGDR